MREFKHEERLSRQRGAERRAGIADGEVDTRQMELSRRPTAVRLARSHFPLDQRTGPDLRATRDEALHLPGAANLSAPEAMAYVVRAERVAGILRGLDPPSRSL